jgi:hypothetical protein
LKSVEGASKPVDSVERIRDQEQIGRLKPGSLARSFDLGANIARAADSYVGMIPQKRQCL